MKISVLVLLCLFSLSAYGFCQNPQLRQQAVELLERANEVSTPPKLPNLERTDTFRVLDATTGPQQGSFSRVVVQGTGRRDEFNFGSFHEVNVFTHSHLATVRTDNLLPAPVLDMMHLTPIDLFRFNGEDVIYAINDETIDDRPARCIEFDTIVGERTEHNELCVDAANGTLLTAKVGRIDVENRDFFPFAGALMPGTIRFSRNGVPELEITQTMTALNNPTPNVLAAPPDAQIRRYCTTYRRPFGTFMPQPKPGSTVGSADIILRGIIGTDGRVHNALVQASDRPDLNAQALNLIQTWTFSPALCNGRPNPTAASFTVHFR